MSEQNPPSQPTYDQLLKERELMRLDLQLFMDNNRKAYQCLFPPGHYYSPLPNLQEVHEDEARIFNHTAPFAGITLVWEEQMALFDNLAKHYDKLPFPALPEPGCRYYYQNGFFTYTDAVMLFCMLHHIKPQKIIEVGSGFSSALMLDTRDHSFHGQLECQFIDPYPERLMQLLTEADLSEGCVIREKLQDVDLQRFEALNENDILFIDSSHVSKVGSDVHQILFNILPRLKKGVLIHFHDVFYPFEYPQAWIYQGIYWNEAYLLRAFLQYNSTFQIEFFPGYLMHHAADTVIARMPLCQHSPAQSIWLRKIA